MIFAPIIKKLVLQYLRKPSGQGATKRYEHGRYVYFEEMI